MFDNVLSVSGGDDRRTFYASLGNTYQNGTIVGDNDKYNRTTARLKATQFFGSKLRVGGNVSYMDVRARHVQKGNNLNTGSGTSTTVEKLGNSINSVKSEDVQKSNEPNIVNALAAKAPGVEITSQAGDPGAGSSIIIRGLKTIQGDGQPLFVIE